MYGCLTLPLYSSMITLPAGPSVADYASALRNIPGYQIASSTGHNNGNMTIRLGNRPRFAFLGTLGTSNYPAPVFVHLTSGNVVTATVSPRHFPAVTIPNTRLRDYQIRTAVHVRDALATVAPEAPVTVTRVAATKAETFRGYASLLAILISGILFAQFLFNSWDPQILISGLVGGTIGASMTLLPAYGKAPARRVEGFQLI